MKTIKLIPFCFLIIGCSTNEYIDNQKMIASIDSLTISKIITEVETDTMGNILDTISIEYLKYDHENQKRFKEKIYWFEDRKISWKDYLKPDEDLFFRQSFGNNGELESTMETRSYPKGRVKKGILINREGELIDTTIMDYIREFHKNGKVKKLLVKTFYENVGEITSKIEYDTEEKVLFEVMIFDNDTMKFQIWEYSYNILQKSILTNYQRDTSKSIYYFGNEELVVTEEEFDFKDGSFI